MKVKVVPHDPRWREAFETESHRVTAALGSNTVAIHHIGSTAIPDIYAKPVIDMLVEVRDINNVDVRAAEMKSLGYEVMGEFGIPGRRYFRRYQKGCRTNQIHVFRAGSDQVIRHLAFRDYMRAHPEEAQLYGDLKRRLATLHPDDPEAYMDGKDAFIKEIDRRAAQWTPSASIQSRKDRL